LTASQYGNRFPYMFAEIGSTIQASVARLLMPLVRLLLRSGVSYGVFADIAKRIYVEVAMADFTIPDRKQTISRASVITGLSRKEVLRVQRLPPLSDEQIQERYNRAVRVVTGWARDASFLSAEGEPKPLPLEGEGETFAQLVRKYSGDAPARAVLDELLRAGSVELLASGEVRLIAPAYVPESGLEDKLSILGSDTADLIATIDHNLVHSGQESRFQLKVSYDNLPEEPLGRFRTFSSEKAFELLKVLDQELSQLDRDVNPASEGRGRIRAGISIYYFEEDLQKGGGEEGQ